MRSAKDLATGPMITTGRWKVVFMIGSPVSQTRAPFLFNRYFSDTGLEILMAPLEVPPDALPSFLSTMRGASNCLGAVVTLPHKTATFHLVDLCSDRARELQSCNVVCRQSDGTLAGDMMDGPGFWNGLGSKGHDPKRRSMVLAGAGAAGTAIALEFGIRGGQRLALLCQSDEDFARLSELVGRWGVETLDGAPESLDGWDFVVNATPVGMARSPGTLFPASLLASMGSKGLVAEAITEPLKTQLIVDASNLGLETVDGNVMTAGQFELLRGFLLIGT